MSRVRSVRFPAGLDERLVARAAELERPVSWVIVKAVEQAVGALTPVPSPAGREAETEAVQVRPVARAAAPQRATGSRSSAELPAGVSRGVDSVMMERQRRLNEGRGS